MGAEFFKCYNPIKNHAGQNLIATIGIFASCQRTILHRAVTVSPLKMDAPYLTVLLEVRKISPLFPWLALHCVYLNFFQLHVFKTKKQISVSSSTTYEEVGLSDMSDLKVSL